MTFASKGQLIFSSVDKFFPDCTFPKPKRSDGKLKSFLSIYDDRVWSLEEKERYRYLLDLMTGSQMCVATSGSRYIPLDAIFQLLLAERDEYIRCLEKQLGIGDPEPGPSGCVSKKMAETPVNEIFKAGTFVDDEELDAMTMKNKIAALTAELEECKATRDTLRAAMHKLENIDDIINENKSLKAKLRCSDEMIKYLEEKKNKLEKELENLRTKSQIRMDLQEAQQRLLEVGERQKRPCGVDLNKLAKERDCLQRRVEELQNELREARTRESELEVLRKQSESATLSLEEITRENECYKKKLASMKDLEKQIEELKRQANQIAEKYKRDAMKACDQEKQIKDICRELNQLRDERDRFRRRVDELACYEQQYNSLQSKLRQVDCILAENAALNSKLASLDKLELENEFLKCKLQQCQVSEMEAAKNKGKIRELENAVADQEEEMKDLLCQIERLTRTYGDRSELDRLKEELCKKDCKLKLCEEQLAEIPLLEAEIDELRSKLQDCYNNVTDSKPKGEEVPPESEAKVIDTKYEEHVSFEKKTAVCADIRTESIQILEKMANEKTMTCEEVQELLQSSKKIITCVLEDMIEHQKEMEELQKCNQEMKEEIEMLKARIGKTDVDELLQEMAELKRCLKEREDRICELEEEIATTRNASDVNEHISNLEKEIECLKDLNKKMRADLREACCEVKRCSELERLLEQEKKARSLAEDAARQGESRTKMQKEEYNIEAKEIMANEIEELKNRIECLDQLVGKYKAENEMLKQREQSNCERFMEEKAALENLLNLMQRELENCRQERDSDEARCLRDEIERLRDQNNRLRSLVNCYKERLELERSSKEMGSRRETTPGLQEENQRLRAEAARMQNELIELCNRLDDCERRYREKSAEFDELLGCYQSLARKSDEMEKLLAHKKESPPPMDDSGKMPKEDFDKRADYDKDMTDQEAIESTIRNVEAEMDGLTTKLEKRGKAELERDDLLQKIADMEAELEELGRQLAECREHRSRSPDGVGEREEKLLEEMVGLREQIEQAKAENKRLKDEVNELRNLLDQYKKTQANEEAQASLMSARQEGISYPVQPTSQEVSQAVLPIKEQERVAHVDRKPVPEAREKPEEEKQIRRSSKAPKEEESVKQEKERQEDQIRREPKVTEKPVAIEQEKYPERERDKERKEEQPRVDQKPQEEKVPTKRDEERKEEQPRVDQKPQEEKVPTKRDEERKEEQPRVDQKPQEEKVPTKRDEERKEEKPRVDQKPQEEKVPTKRDEERKEEQPRAVQKPQEEKVPTKRDEERKEEKPRVDQKPQEEKVPTKRDEERKEEKPRVDQKPQEEKVPTKRDEERKEEQPRVVQKPQEEKVPTKRDEERKEEPRVVQKPQEEKVPTKREKERQEDQSRREQKAQEDEKVEKDKKAQKSEDEKTEVAEKVGKEDKAREGTETRKPERAKESVEARRDEKPEERVKDRALAGPPRGEKQDKEKKSTESERERKQLGPPKVEKPDREKKSEESERSERPERLQRPERPEKPEKPERGRTVAGPPRAERHDVEKKSTESDRVYRVIRPRREKHEEGVSAPKGEEPRKEKKEEEEEKVRESFLPGKAEKPEIEKKPAEGERAKEAVIPVKAIKPMLDKRPSDGDKGKIGRMARPGEGMPVSKVEKPEKEKKPEEGFKAEKLPEIIHSAESMVSLSDLDPGYAKFVCGLNPFDHKQNVYDIERRLREVMSELNRKNDEKVKRLMDQHRKESAMKDKAFNENISSLRSGYESDIRKLVDRHKESILRLQNIHEDQVRELNDNYEKQMQAMQTQNENVVSDLAEGVAKKFEAIAEQHNRDLKEVEEKYQKMLQEKEEEYVKAIVGNEPGTNFEEELNRLRKNNMKKVEIMQQKYEKLLACERKKYEQQLEETVQKLKEGKGVAHGVCQCRFPLFDAKDRTAPLEFNDVLQKILRYGLESLTFNEVALVHRRTCAATGGVVIDPDLRLHVLPVMLEEDPDDAALAKPNRDELLGRILALENEIAMRQTETQDAIVNMELAVKAERQRLQMLRESLRQEQEKNSDMRPRMLMMPRMAPMSRRPIQQSTLTRCGYDAPYMPPIRIEDLVPTYRPAMKAMPEVQGPSCRGQPVTDKMKEIKSCECTSPPPLTAEKDTTKAKQQKKEVVKPGAKDLKMKYKVPVKKKGKK